MRDDPRVAIAALIVSIPVFFMMLSTAFGSGADNPTWELRWRSLGSAERDRLASAARSGIKLDDPEDAELAAGFANRRSRRSAYIEAPITLLFVAATALSLVGAAHGVTGWALPIVGILPGLWYWFGEKRLNGASRVVAAPGASR
jgi:hypothetical protein